MKTPTISLRRRGTALVVVLCSIVIMSILLISYLVAMQLDRLSTQNYSQSIKAQELGQGALQEILGDLRQEINAGSLQDGTPSGAVYTSNNVRVFIPSTNLTTAPARIGFTTTQFADLPATLVRVSRASDPFFSSPPAGYEASLLPSNRASAAPSTTPSANRRLITAERWNKPRLFGTNVPTVISNSPPDWVYVTRGGSRILSAADLPTTAASPNLGNTNTVLGRYSFVIYEEGGLLDLNAAGYPSSALSEANGTNAISGKSYTAYADLSQLPGMSSTTVDQIITWRSKGSLAAQASRFIPAATNSAATGFRTFAGGDNPLLGRQDLINYFQQNAALSGNLDALQYLGTFSRAVNAPSWFPTTPAGSSVDYAANAESARIFHPGEGAGGTANTPNPNRNIANLRAPSNTAVTHYLDDGSTTTYTIKAGEPAFARRFSLARLAWLTPDGAAPGMATAIKDCFGLSWTTDNHGYPCWKYDHGNSQEILTLDQVAALGREPDFFELLKAAILAGSLGKHPGAVNLAKDNNTDPWSSPAGFAFGNIGVSGLDFDTSLSFPDLQILQIGANIIDQYDADGFPTEIYFDPSLDSSRTRGPENIVYGQENLPQITRLFPIYTEKTSGFLDGWIQPEIWNINQQPTAATLAAKRPTHFRLALNGSAYVSWYQADGSVAGGKRQSASVSTSFSPSEAKSYLYFTDTGDGSSAFFNAPAILTKDNAGTFSGTSAENLWQASTYQSTDGGNPFLAFHIGSAIFGTGTAAITDAVDDVNKPIVAQIVPNPILTVTLEYSPDDGSTYRPYAHVSRISSYSSDDARGDGSGRTSVSNHSMHYLYPSAYFGVTGDYVPYVYRYYSRSDPRTDRFSLNQTELDHAGEGPTGYQGKWKANMSIIPNGFTGDGFKTTPRCNTPRPDVASAGVGAANPANKFFYTPNAVRSGWEYMWQNTLAVGDWVQNLEYDSNDPRAKWSWVWYGDPDGVIRPGDGYRALYTEPGGDGTMQFTTPANSTANTQNARRPVILNRPFRSVGELGYAFRDLPYKSLDFFSKKSADGALLDMFTVTEEPAIIAGQINPNFAPASVLQSVLTGAGKKEISPGLQISAANAELMAKAIASTVQASGPGLVSNRAALVTALADPLFNSLPASADSGNKAYLEAPVRALSSVSNTRTWNLLIDVIAQTGRMAPNAQTLNSFIVEGEKRYWLHVALDRFTGKVIDQQLEPVYE